MTDDLVKQILETKSIEEVDVLEEIELMAARNKFYNDILENKETKKHLLDLYGVDENIIQNILCINGYPPLDDIDKISAD